MGVSINGGTPIAGWFIRENPIKMDVFFQGSPMTWETSGYQWTITFGGMVGFRHVFFRFGHVLRNPNTSFQ